MPLQHLFVKREQRYFKDVTPETLVDIGARFWRDRGFVINFQGPFTFSATAMSTSIGLRQVAEIMVFQNPEGYWTIDLTYSATLGDGQMMLGVVGAVVVFPLAAVAGGISYIEYENQASAAIAGFWTDLTNKADHKEGPRPSEVSGIVLENCPRCQAKVDPDGRFCKHCGLEIRPS